METEIRIAGSRCADSDIIHTPQWCLFNNSLLPL